MGHKQVARAPSLLKRCFACCWSYGCIPEISWGDDDRPSLISADACGRRLVLHALQPWTLLWLKWCVAVYCCCTLLSGYFVSARQCSTLGLCSQRESGITFYSRCDSHCASGGLLRLHAVDRGCDWAQIHACCDVSGGVLGQRFVLERFRLE